MNRNHALPALLALFAAAAFAPHAHATVYTVDCGAGGTTAALQAQIATIGSSPGHQINVLGTCVGDVNTSNADRLHIAGLVLTGSVYMTSAQGMRFTNLTINGGLTLQNSRSATFSGTTVRGVVSVMRGSQAVFSNFTANTYVESGVTYDPSFNCVGQSECSLNNATLTGSFTSSTSIGILAASASRLNFSTGSISGFGTGLQAWNNASAFVNAGCDPITIQGNAVAGVSAVDTGIVKVYGISAAEATDYGCPGPVIVQISNNGNYGVFADGGGNAYLQNTRVRRHLLEGVRVQNGSVVRVRSSEIDAAKKTGRSARVKGNAHLYFDEQEAGPAAGSTLAGPVCVTGSSTVDTDNSSTVVTVLTSCP
jgi:hypothetical protein